MRLVKIFECAEDQVGELEKEINAWVRKTGAHVVSVTGNIAPQGPTSMPRAHPAPSDVLLIVLYELRAS